MANYSVKNESYAESVSNGQSVSKYYVTVTADTAADIPDPDPTWAPGSECRVLADGGSKYVLSNAGEWVEVPNFTKQAGGGDEISSDLLLADFEVLPPRYQYNPSAGGFFAGWTNPQDYANSYSNCVVEYYFMAGNKIKAHCKITNNDGASTIEWLDNTSLPDGVSILSTTDASECASKGFTFSPAILSTIHPSTNANNVQYAAIDAWSIFNLIKGFAHYSVYAKMTANT